MNEIKHHYSEYFELKSDSFKFVEKSPGPIRAFVSPKPTKDGMYLVHIFFIFTTFSDNEYKPSIQIPIGKLKITKKESMIKSKELSSRIKEEITLLINEAEKSHRIFKAIMKFTFEGVEPKL